MDLQSLRRIVLALSVALLGAGFWLTSYDAYRSVQYESALERRNAAMRPYRECELRVSADMQAALPVAQRWYHAHRHEYQATADGVQVLWHPFWHPAMVMREPG